MRTNFRFAVVSSLLLLGALLAAGCGGSGVIVEGKLLNNGQPFAFDDNKEEVHLAFVSAHGDRTSSFQGMVDPEGTFRVTDSQGKGIPPGAYKVTLRVLPYQKVIEDEEDPAKIDKFRGKYSLDKTALKVDITDNRKNITIDVGTGVVSQ